MSNYTFDEAFKVLEGTFDRLGSTVKDDTLMRVVKNLMESSYHLGGKHEIERMSKGNKYAD